MSSSNNGISDQLTDYEYAQPIMGLGQPTSTSGHYGDSVWEVSSTTSSPNDDSWYGDYSTFPSSINPLFIYGGGYGDKYNAGEFAFSCAAGFTYNGVGFRLVLPVL